MPGCAPTPRTTTRRPRPHVNPRRPRRPGPAEVRGAVGNASRAAAVDTVAGRRVRTHRTAGVVVDELLVDQAEAEAAAGSSPLQRPDGSAIPVDVSSYDIAWPPSSEEMRCECNIFGLSGVDGDVRGDAVVLQEPEGADQSSLAEVLVAERDRLMAMAYLLVGDRAAAEDLVQGVISKLWASGKEIEHPKAYARKALLHDFLNQRRRMQRAQRAMLLEQHSSPSSSTFEHDLIEREMVRRAVSRLAPRYRAVIVLRYFDDLGDDAIAALLGCEVGTVRSLLSRARRRLHRDLSIELAKERTDG